MPLTSGTRLGSYEIIAPLGAGGMGEVFPESISRDAGRLARFEREARAVAALSHPNIVVLHSIEHASSVHFLTLELVEGRTLDDAWLDRALETRDAGVALVLVTRQLQSLHGDPRWPRFLRRIGLEP
jgi:eukaryotic-like serine/threonine-protein kinase